MDKLCGPKKTTKRYTKQTFFDEVSIESLLSFYMRLRIYEQKPEMPDTERDKVDKRLFEAVQGRRIIEADDNF